MCNLHVNTGILHHSFSILWVISQYYFVLVQSLHKALPNTILYYKACTKYFPVLLYYKACTNYFTALLCTTKLAQSTFQYYFVLQSLYELLPSTTLYYKAYTKHVPILLCFTKFVRTTSQYYFVLQSLHKARSSTTLYYKACTKHFPVLLCTSQRCSSFKAAVQSYSASKLLRTISQSCFLKLFPKAIVFQSKCPSMLFSKPQSCSPQLLPKAALQSCYRKPRPKNAPQNSNAVTRSCLKAGPEGCPKLLPKATAQSCSPALLPKVVPQSCSPKLLP